MKEARIICIGKLKTACWKDACAHYLNQLRRLRPVTITELRDGNPELASGERNAQEGSRIIAAFQTGDLPICLDQGGTQMSSPDFARLLRKCDEDFQKRPAFVIGGAFGLAPDVLSACKIRLSLSAMTWPHELARTLLLEQIYRGECILRGYPYHH